METKLISRMPFKKILIIINALTMGGAQMRVLKTARFLIKKNIKVYIIAFKSGEMADSFKDMGVMVNIYPFHVLHQIDLVLAIRNEILKINPSIVHTHLGAAGFFGRIAVFLARKKGWQGKTATTQHGLEKYRYRAMEPILSLVNDHLIAVSEHVKSLWYKNRRDVHVIPGSTLDKRALEFHGFSLKTSDPGPEWSIGFRGRLSREKGIDILISALGILKKRNHLVRLLISGSGPEKERLYKITQQLGLLKEITFVQHMEALEFYSRIDIFVLPSRQEGQGLALLEAMNYGCLCIGSKVGGIAETIRPNDNGILFEPQNVAALAAALEDIIKNPLKRAGITARAGEYALKHTAEKMNNKLFSLFSGCSKGRKKLLLAVSSSIIGGGEQHTLYLGKELNRQKWDITVLVSAKGVLYNTFKAMGLKVFAVPMNDNFNLFSFAAVFSFIRKGGFDIVHSHLNRACLFCSLACKILKIPNVSTVHGLNRSIYYRGASKIIAVCRAGADHLVKQGISEKKIDLVYNALPNSFISFGDDSPGDDRPVDDRPGQMVFGMLGKLHENKGHLVVIKALKELEKIKKINSLTGPKLPDIKLEIAGTGSSRYKNRVIKKIREYGLEDHVEFMGFQKDPASIFKRWNALIIASYKEAFPYAALEAMASQLICIASKTGGMPELIEHKKDGLLFKTGDSFDLCASLLWFIKNPAQSHQMALAGQKKIVKNHRLKDAVKSTEKVYDSFFEK